MHLIARWDSLLSLAPVPLVAPSGTHLAAWITVPGAAVAGLLLAWLWWHVGRPGVERSRRLIRRTSLALALALVPLLVVGTSFVDSSLEPRRYAEVWTVALGVLALVVATAGLDAANSLRLHLRESHAEHLASARELRASFERTKRAREASGRAAGLSGGAMEQEQQEARAPQRPGEGS